MSRLVLGKVSNRGLVDALGKNIPHPELAFAEFIDNALASRDEAKKLGYHIPSVKILIRFHRNDHNDIRGVSIRDTSIGMSASTVETKLFHLHDRQLESKGLHEFGVGAKDAIGYLAGPEGHFSLRTIHAAAPGEKSKVTELKETSLRAIYGNAVQMQDDQENVTNDPIGTVWTIHSIKGGFSRSRQKSLAGDLGSLYRAPINEGTLVIEVEDEDQELFQSSYSRPDVLVCEKALPNKIMLWGDPKRRWEQAVDFDVQIPPELGLSNPTLRVTGFIACLADMKEAIAGFAIIRRGRVVMMNGNIQWRPNPPFKNNAGSHVDKRLFGELVIDDIPTSLNKAEADNRIAGPLANALIEHLHAVDPNGVLSQARNFYIDTYKVQLKERAGGNSPGTPNDPQDEPVEGKTAATGVSNSSSVLTSAIDDGKKFLAGSFLMPDDMKRVPLFVTRDNVPATWGQGSLSLTVSVPALVHRNLKINSADELCLIVLRYIVAIEVAKVSNAIAELEVLLPKISIFPSQS